MKKDTGSMVVGLLNSDGVEAPATFSGTARSIARICAAHFPRSAVIPPIRHQSLLVSRIVDRCARLFGRRFDIFHTLYRARAHSARNRRLVRRIGPDLILSINASTDIAFLRTRIPIIHIADATYELLLDYYPRYAGTLGISRRWGHRVEAEVCRRSAALLFTSEWAARSAIEFYRTPADRVHVVPLGPNLEESLIPPSRAASDLPAPSTCRLLFVGNDWRRKGGEGAVHTLNILRERGVPAVLTIVGCEPPPSVRRSNMMIHPRLSKEREEERSLFVRLLADATFLVLPTRADCTPIVFAEANAFGTPVLSTDTGGIPTVVDPGHSGVLFAPDAPDEAYADTIMYYLSNPEAYRRLRETSRRHYETTLNWQTWIGRLKEIIAGIA